MADKRYQSRVQHKSGTIEEWSHATNFTPLDGELLVYTDAGGTDDNGKPIPQIKIGNGKNLVADLPFVKSKETENANHAVSADKATKAESADTATRADTATKAESADVADAVANKLIFKVNGTGVENGSYNGSSEISMNFVPGNNISLTANHGQITIASSVPVAGTTIGGIKSGGDIEISAEGIITVKDDSHNHVISNVDGLQAALDGKSANGHGHTISASATDGIFDLTGSGGTNSVSYSLAPYSSSTATTTWVSNNAGKFYLGTSAPSKDTRLNYNGHLYATKLYSGGTEVSKSGHKHVVSDITGLQGSLDGKSDSSHTHTITANATDGIFNLIGTKGTNAVTYELKPYETASAGKFDTGSTNPSGTIRLNWGGYLYSTKLYSGGKEVSVSGHKHAISDVTNLQGALDGKAASGHSHTITANATDGLFDIIGTNGTNAVTYSVAPYSSATATETWIKNDSNGGKFYLGSNAAPAKTTRLNYNGYLYASKLFSGDKEVSVTGHKHVISDVTSLQSTLDTKLNLSGGTLSGHIAIPATPHNWIDGMTPSNVSIQISTQQQASAYSPYFYVKTSGSNVVNLGGMGNRVGFYGFKSGRTENQVDWSFTIDSSTGEVYSTHKMHAPTFEGTLSGNATTATTASKLGTTNVGTATNPIYLDKGVPKACTYTLEKSVPSNAVFTDTKVTQAATITTNGSYPVLLGYSTETTSVTNTVNKSARLTFNPSTGVLTVTGIVAQTVDATIDDGSID